MSKRRQPAHSRGNVPAERRNESIPGSGKPKLPPANPPRKHLAFLVATSIALVLWLAFLVVMAIWY
ncbi:MAG TPA: hypothetical protein VND64_17050 [Pirellulales bacterium]|nr:hypothetical protein [Pirellulales bacterium]